MTAAADALFDLGSRTGTHRALDLWRDALDEAVSRTEVMVLANGFVAQWEETELATLPEGCRPWRVIDATDVHFLKHLLASQGLAGDPEGGPLLRYMRAFFQNASRRLSELPANEG